MARLTARSQRRAQQRAARARATDAKKTWGKAAGRAVCEFGTRRVQLWKPRCGATTRAASLHGARQDRATRATRCGNAHGEITASCANARRESAGDGREEEGRKAASLATPRATDSTRAWGKAAGGDAGGESRNSLRVWHAARAALDAATQRKRGPQPCRTSNAMWEGAWREHSVLRNNAA